MIPVSKTKEHLTLDLTSKRTIPTSNTGMSNITKLPSPDFVRMRAPEMENYFFDHIQSPSATFQFLYPKTFVDDYELYPRDFYDAIGKFPNYFTPTPLQVGLPKSSSSSNLSSDDQYVDNHSLTPLSTPYSMVTSSVVKKEPCNVSPIDMESQERIKLDLKRKRNRVAASKCRQRKLTRIKKLEDKVKALKQENHDSSQACDKLKEEVAELRIKIKRHEDNGCNFNAPLKL